MRVTFSPPPRAFRARIRHYWSVVDYHQFYELNADGSLNADTPFNELLIDEATGTSSRDLNYNAWSVDWSTAGFSLREVN